MQSREREAVLLEELKKDPEVMDTEQIDALMHQAGMVPDADVQWMLVRNEKRYAASLRRAQTKNIIKRMSAVAAIFLLLFGASFGAAHAFGWRALLAFFHPLEEVLSFIKTDQAALDESSSAPRQSDPQPEADMEADRAEEKSFQAIQEVLPQLDAVRREDYLRLVNEFALQSGDFYKDRSSVIVTMTFDDSAGNLFFFEANTFIDSAKPSVMGNVFMERDANSMEIQVAGVTMIAQTENQGIGNLQWTEGNTYYRLWGKQSLDALQAIANIFLKE